MKRYITYFVICAFSVPQNFSRVSQASDQKTTDGSFVYNLKCDDSPNREDFSYACIRNRAIHAAVAFDINPKLLLCIFRQETGGTYRLDLSKGNGKGLAQLTMPAINEFDDQINNLKFSYSTEIRKSFFEYYNRLYTHNLTNINLKDDHFAFKIDPFKRDDSIVAASVLIKTLQYRYGIKEYKELAKHYNGSYLKIEYSENVEICMKNFALVERYEQGRYFKVASK